jgi:peptide deformylase
MAIRKIIKYPQPSLLKPCMPVSFPLTEMVQEHLRDLLDTLAASDSGVALASNQILADGLRLFVVKDGYGLPTELFNPEWNVIEDDLIMPMLEGCLSIPELQLYAPRHQTIQVKWFTRSGEITGSQIASGLAAQIVQHEVEHLNGELLINYAKKDLALRVRMEAIRNRKAGK